MTTTDAATMAVALEQARQALLAGEAPIGACLVCDGEVVAAHNAVIAGPDPTAHAEISVIRAAAASLRRLDFTGARLFVTVEPCAMCRAACHYAGIDEVVFAASLDDMQALTGNELAAQASGTAIPRMTGGVLREESLRLLQAWAARRHA